MTATVQPENRTYTIWKNGCKFEWIIRDGEQIVARSGLIHNSYATAKRKMISALSQADETRD